MEVEIAWVKIVAGVVVQKQPYEEDGFVPAPSDVVCGMISLPGGGFKSPPAPDRNPFPHLEPDQFWFVVRASGHEGDLKDWVSAMNDPQSATYNPVEWAQVSAKLDFAKFFERDHELVEAARIALEISTEELDALWQYAAG